MWQQCGAFSIDATASTPPSDVTTSSEAEPAKEQASRTALSAKESPATQPVSGIAGGPKLQFTWESAGTNKEAMTLTAPNGQAEKQSGSWAVSGDTLTFIPETLTLKRASAQPTSQHLAHTWRSEPSFSKTLKQTAVFEKTGALTLTTENDKPVQGTWDATGNQLTLSHPDAVSGELQTLVYQMTLGEQVEEKGDTLITADLYLKGVGKEKASLLYTRPLQPDADDGAASAEATATE